MSCGFMAGGCSLLFSSRLLPALKPNMPGFCQLLSSIYPMNIILFTFPPKVLLGLKPPTSLLLLIASVSFLFLNIGSYRLSNCAKDGCGFWTPIQSTYCANSSKLLLSFESSCENLFHQAIAGSVFFKLGRKTFSTNVLKTEMSLLSAILNKSYRLVCLIRFSREYMLNHFTSAWVLQYFTLSRYFSRSKATPDPPCSFPNAFRMMVIGSIGVSQGTSVGLTETIPKSQSTFAFGSALPIAQFQRCTCSLEQRIKSRYLAGFSSRSSFAKKRLRTGSSFSVLASYVVFSKCQFFGVIQTVEMSTLAKFSMKTCLQKGAQPSRSSAFWKYSLALASNSWMSQSMKPVAPFTNCRLQNGSECLMRYPLRFC